MFNSKLKKDEEKKPWTLANAVNYADTKMELDHACKIQLDDNIFCKRRSVFLFQEDIYDFSKMKIIGQNCLAIYIRLVNLQVLIMFSI